MSYAIAKTGPTLAHHFSKAELFCFYDDNQRKIAVYKNPILENPGCAGKQSLITLLKQRQCHTVIVRKIGQKTLARLLDAGFKVVQGNTRHSIEAMLNDAQLDKNRLTEATQGVQKNSCSSEKTSAQHNCCAK